MPNTSVSSPNIFRRCVNTPADSGGIRNTTPSSSKPTKDAGMRPAHVDDDRGYLTFTRASLFKLTLPLAPPSDDPKSPTSKASSAAARAQRRQAEQGNGEEEPKQHLQPAKDSVRSWERRVEDGETVSQVYDDQKADGKTKADRAQEVEDMMTDRAELEFDAHAPAHSVVFLLHGGQPLSYVSSLIRSEGPSARPLPSHTHGDHPPGTPPDDTLDSRLPAITFHTRRSELKRWSPATGFNDYVREAARLGSFTIRIGEREIEVNVPSFEDRTRFLRSRLYACTDEIERLRVLKVECDKLAQVGTKRFAFAGAGVLATWWVTVSYFTFFTEYGWDVMEPATYLVGLGTLMGGYVWFLLHNREVSYRAVLNETTSRRQQMLYEQRGLNVVRYEELIDEAKSLRSQIKRVAEDYGLEWDQGETVSGQKAKRALDVVRRREAADEKGGRSVSSRVQLLH
ncbi:related to coq2-para-hydroxybenzoate--polyprenyltransferase [Ceraceosorus bombacis]|uniref:Calcium uniporter protein, mitochondrial n=1 Tax=Ceraceosorus bombacis TaxID=401625 RepID=A0A0P1BSU0_9BASI|nr:related to coq2-para-hydroxybenzoate--polyprenyltransferase [Ceraceosorus bombacis]